MDLAYLREHPAHLPAFLTHQRIRETPVAGGDICAASRLTLDDGSSVFAKTWPSGPPPDGFFAAEAHGLRWLRAAGGAPVPEVIADLPELLAMEWVEPGTASVRAADRFGRDLAATHRAGAEAYGAPWPGYIGGLPLDNAPSTGPWGPWYAQRRLAPYLRLAADRGALAGTDVTLAERLLAVLGEYDPGESPARIHGDLWPGNVLWSAGDRAWIVDPAAHGGHRETDVACLALFGGAPHLARIVSAYEEIWPLAPGWRARIPLHQLHLLLVHAAMFGSAYADAVRRATRGALDALVG